MSESLSEHERRQLAELEQQLEADDPRLAASLADQDVKRRSGKHMLLGILLVVVGLVALIGSIATTAAFLGVAGLLVMTVGVAWIVYRGFNAGGRSRVWMKSLLGRR